MILTVQERFFIEKRRRLTRLWPVVSGALLIAILSFVGWLFWVNPLLVNPWAVIARLQAHSLPESTLSVMAFMLPVAMLLCIAILCILLLLAFLAVSNERRHLAIIDRLCAAPDAGECRGAGTD